METTLPNFLFTLLSLVFCLGDVAALSFLLTWQERAASPSARRARWWRGVVPGAMVLVGLLLLAFFQTMRLWSGQ